MNEDLFFIAILAEAVRHPNPTKALEEAFERIRSLGRQSRYELGYRRWLRFIEDAAPEPNDLERATIRQVAAQLAFDRSHATGQPHPDELRGTDVPAEDDTDARAMEAMHDMGERPGSVSLVIRRDDQLVASLSLEPADLGLLRQIRPGSYAFTLDTGRLLWSGQITEAELVWQLAFPDRPLTLAADSTIPTVRPTKTIPLGVGDLSIVVYPGVETGSMRLAVGKPDA